MALLPVVSFLLQRYVFMINNKTFFSFSNHDSLCADAFVCRYLYKV